jgi:hypothetical protein
MAKVSIGAPCDNILEFKNRSRGQHICVGTRLPNGRFFIFHSFVNKRFWEELIAYFPFLWHEPRKKQHLQQLFTAMGTSLPSYYLATMGEIQKQTHRLAFDKKRTA